MNRFTLYGIPGSPFLRSVLLAFEEKNVPCRVEGVQPGAHKQPEYLKRNPFGRIPAMSDGDFMLYETQAMMRYLDRLFPEPALTPTDPRDEARMNQIIGINDWYLFPDCGAGIAFQRLIAPKFGLPSDEKKIAESVPKAEICMNALAPLLGDRTFMAGEQVSIADLMVAAQIDFFAETPEGKVILDRHPNIVAWLVRMRARDSMKNTTWERVKEMAAAA